MAASTQNANAGEKLKEHVEYSLAPIGILDSVFLHKNGTPRQPTVCQASRASLTITKSVFNNPEHSLQGLAEFSHVWLLFVFHLNNNACSKAKVKPPRLDGGKLGVFATRSPYRPSPIGLTLAKVESIDGATLHLSGVDIVNGTPILDIKPFIPEYDNPSAHRTTSHDAVQPPSADIAADSSSGGVQSAGWINNKDSAIMSVSYTSEALAQLGMFEYGMETDYALTLLKSSSEAKQAVTDVLLADPRSVYRRKSCSDRLYYFTVDSMHVTCWFDGSKAQVLKVQPVRHVEHLQTSDHCVS